MTEELVVGPRWDDADGLAGVYQHPEPFLIDECTIVRTFSIPTDLTHFIALRHGQYLDSINSLSPTRTRAELAKTADSMTLKTLQMSGIALC